MRKLTPRQLMTFDRTQQRRSDLSNQESIDIVKAVLADNFEKAQDRLRKAKIWLFVRLFMYIVLISMATALLVAFLST